jgi:hypothetical protein
MAARNCFRYFFRHIFADGSRPVLAGTHALSNISNKSQAAGLSLASFSYLMTLLRASTPAVLRGCCCSVSIYSIGFVDSFAVTLRFRRKCRQR